MIVLELEHTSTIHIRRLCNPTDVKICLKNSLHLFLTQARFLLIDSSSLMSEAGAGVSTDSAELPISGFHDILQASPHFLHHAPQLPTYCTVFLFLSLIATSPRPMDFS
jgi:hypothetical protein